MVGIVTNHSTATMTQFCCINLKIANDTFVRLCARCLMRLFINIGLAVRAVLAMGGTQIRPGRAHVAMPNIFRIGMATVTAYIRVCTNCFVRHD